MADPTVMDAINLALETGDVGASSGDATPGPEANSDEVEGNTSAEGAGAGGSDSLEEGSDKGAVGSSEDDGEGGEQGGEKAAEGEQLDEGGKPGFKRDPVTGKFVKDEKAADAAKPADAKPGEKPGDKPEAKKPDAVNDPIPKELSQGTQERMRTLVKMTKDLTAERDTATQNFDQLVSGVQATGTTPEQYGEVLSFMAMFNSQDPEQQGKALELLEGVADRLAMLLGKERASSDPLTAHADLREAIAKGQITPQYAKEVARNRNSNTFKTELNTSHTKATQEAQVKQQELDTARSDLNTLEQTLKATDPQYGAKREILVPILKTIFKSLPPSQWKAKFEETYKTIRVAAAAKPAVPANQPMRAGRGGGASASGSKGNSSGMSQQPGSAMDVINAALANVPRR